MNVLEYKEKLQAKAHEDLVLDETKLVYESSRTPQLYVRWLDIHKAVKEELRTAQSSYQMKERDKTLYYSGKGTAQEYKENPFNLKILKTEIPMFLNADKELQALKEQVQQLEDLEEFVRYICIEITRRSFHIKNMLETMKWENGS